MHWGSSVGPSVQVSQPNLPHPQICYYLWEKTTLKPNQAPVFLARWKLHPQDYHYFKKISVDLIMFGLAWPDLQAMLAL